MSHGVVASRGVSSVNLEGSHALRAQVHGPEVLVKLLLAHPKQSVLRHLRLQQGFHLWVLLPAGRQAVDVGPHPLLKLTSAPRISDLNQIHAAAGDVGERLEHCVRVSVDDSVVFHPIVVALGRAPDDEVCSVPSDQLMEELLPRDGTLTPAANLWPVLLPHRRLLILAAVREIVVEVPMFVVVAPAVPLPLVLAGSLHLNRVLVLATR
mmetsp:Transcript_10731/g.46476  ORF Transcript_10731/g.46476 Transcript_10731/m.46476 type:complete len:209 (-) Transcript_10731:1143-1769(-)